MKEQEKTLALRYSLCQGSYWTAFCSTGSFASVFLLARSFNSGQIGALLACGNIIAAVLQPLIAQRADQGGRLGLKNLTLLLSLIGLASVVGLLIPGSMAVIAGFFILTLSVGTVIQPLINSIGVYYMNRSGRLNYGFARAMGSLIFAILSFVLGILVERYNENVVMVTSLIGYVLLFLVVLSFDIKSPDNRNMGEKGGKNKSGYRSFFKKYRQFSLMLVGVFFLFIFHFIANTYLLQIISAVGGTSREMGTAIAVAAVLELPAMIFFSYIVKKFGVERLLKIAGIFFFVKALLTCLASSVAGIYVAQVFQMLSFAIYYPASVYYGNQVMEEEDKVKGQALTTAAYTVGGIVGNFMGGYLIDWSGISAMLIFGAVSAGIGMLILLLTIPGKKKCA